MGTILRASGQDQFDAAAYEKATLHQAQLEARFQATLAQIEADLKLANSGPDREVKRQAVALDASARACALQGRAAGVAASSHYRPREVADTVSNAWMRDATWVTSPDGLKLEVDWESRQTQPGLPWSSGEYQGESLPELAPYMARGSGSDLGVYADLYNLGVVTDAIEGPVRAIAGLRMQVEPHPEEDWMGPEEKTLIRKHYEFGAQAVHYWGEENTSSLVEGMLRTPLKFGHGLWEIELNNMPMRVLGQRRVLPTPVCPHWISPSATEWWITQHEKPVAVAFDFTQSVDLSGQVGGRPVLPWEKLMWVGHRADGSNLEGIALVRPVYREALMYRALRQLQVLAAEVSALGDRVVTLGDKTGGAAVATLSRHLSMFVARVAPYLILPSGCTYQWISPQNSIPDFGPLLDQLRQDMGYGLSNSSSMVGILHSAGSYAMKESASNEDRKSLQWIYRRLVAQPLSSQLMTRALRQAFPEDDRVFPPVFRPEDTSQRDPSVWASSMATLEGAGLLRLRGAVGQEARQKMGLPADLPEDEYTDAAPEQEAPARAPEVAQQAPAAPPQEDLQEQGGQEASAQAGHSCGGHGVKAAVEVTDARGQRIMVRRALRESERVLALTDMEDLLDTAQERIARDLELVGGRHEEWIRERVPNITALTGEEMQALESEARTIFVPQYRAAAQAQLDRVVTEAVRLVRDEVIEAGALAGSWSSAVVVDVTGPAQMLADASFGVTHTAVLGAMEAGEMRGTPTRSTYLRLARSRVAVAFAKARTAALALNQEALVAGVVERSSVLDKNSCPACSALDGMRFELLSPAYFDNEPPRHCQGRGNCRCIYVFVSDAEGA